MGNPSYAHSHDGDGDGSCFRQRVHRLAQDTARRAPHPPPRHARAMPIVAAYSKIEDEAKDTEVCPHACVMSHLAYGPREPVDLLPLARARPLSPSPHDTTVHAFTAHPQLSPLLPAQCSRLCPRRQSKL